MNDDNPVTASHTTEQRPAPRSRSWLQIRLSTLLAFVLGVGVGLTLRYQFGEEPGRLPSPLPNPSGIRPGDKLILEVSGPNVPPSKRTVLVLADGTISLPNLGQVPAAGLSLEELTADLKQRYYAHYGKRNPVNPGYVEVFVSFAGSSVGDDRP